jgi:hypothetical protein
MKRFYKISLLHVLVPHCQVLICLCLTPKTGINDFHKALGHPSAEDTTRRMQTFYGLNLSGTMDRCVNCAEGKNRLQNINKDAEGGSKIPGECLSIDTSLLDQEQKLGMIKILVVGT